MVVEHGVHPCARLLETSPGVGDSSNVVMGLSDGLVVNSAVAPAPPWVDSSCVVEEEGTDCDS